MGNASVSLYRPHLRSRRVGERVSVGKEGVKVAVAAAPGRHRLALLHRVKAAGYDGGRDVLAAIPAGLRRRRSCQSNECQGEQRRCRRCGQPKKPLHGALSLFTWWLYSLGSHVGCRHTRRYARMADALSTLLSVRSCSQSELPRLIRREKAPGFI